MRPGRVEGAPVEATQAQDVSARGAGDFVVLIFAGFGIFAFGALTLLAGSLHYTNFWGGLVFAPFALVIGALFINFAVRY